MIPIPPRILVIGGVAAALLVAGGGLYYKGRAEQAARDKAAVAASQAQARVSDVVAKALDTHTVQTIIIRERESRAVQTIQSAPGAGDIIPVDLRDAWARGLRDIETGAAGDIRPGQPESDVPPT